MSGKDAVLDVILEIRELLGLMAEPAVAQRDAKLRASLRQIVGRSKPKARAICLMDGIASQSEISVSSGFHKSD